MRHGVAVRSRGVKYLVSRYDNNSAERSVKDTKMIWSRYLNISRNNTSNFEDGDKLAHEAEGECTGVVEA